MIANKAYTITSIATLRKSDGTIVSQVLNVEKSDDGADFASIQISAPERFWTFAFGEEVTATIEFPEKVSGANA